MKCCASCAGFKLVSWLMRQNERQPKRGSKVSQCGQFDMVTIGDTAGLQHIFAAPHGHLRAPGATCGHQASAPAESDPGLSHVLGQEQALGKFVPRLCDYASQFILYHPEE